MLNASRKLKTVEKFMIEETKPLVFDENWVSSSGTSLLMTTLGLFGLSGLQLNVQNLMFVG